MSLGCCFFRYFFYRQKHVKYPTLKYLLLKIAENHHFFRQVLYTITTNSHSKKMATIYSIFFRLVLWCLFFQLVFLGVIFCSYDKCTTMWAKWRIFKWKKGRSHGFACRIYAAIMEIKTNVNHKQNPSRTNINRIRSKNGEHYKRSIGLKYQFDSRDEKSLSSIYIC